MTLTVTTAPSYLAPNPSVAVTVSASPVVSVPLTVYRVHADGSEHPVIAAAGNRALFGGSWVEVDRHPPFNQSISYRAVTATEEGTSSPTIVPSSAAWLVHPSEPDLAVSVSRLGPAPDRVFEGSAARLDILGSSHPIHQWDRPVSVESGSVTVKAVSPAALSALRALLADGGPLLLVTPDSDFDIRWLWVQPTGFTVHNPAGFSSFDRRYVVIPFEGTRQPDVDTVPLWTFDDITALGLTYTELAALYATYDDMALDVRSP